MAFNTNMTMSQTTLFHLTRQRDQATKQLCRLQLYRPCVLYSECDVPIKTSNVTGRHRGPKRKRTSVCRYAAPLVSVITTLIMLFLLFFIVQCGIARFLCAMRVFEVRASSSSSRLPLCQILFLSRPPLLG